MTGNNAYSGYNPKSPYSLTVPSTTTSNFFNPSTLVQSPKTITNSA